MQPSGGSTGEKSLPTRAPFAKCVVAVGSILLECLPLNLLENHRHMQETSKPDVTTQRIAGRLHRVVPIKDAAGKVISISFLPKTLIKSEE